MAVTAWGDRRRGLGLPLLLLLCTSPVTTALAQQPAQRVLPQAVPGDPLPFARDLCLPQLDEELRLFVQPCRSGGQPPTAEWRDRMVHLLTRKAGALLWWDLDPVERERAVAWLTGSTLPWPQLSPEEVAASQERRTVYADRRKAILAEAGFGPDGLPPPVRGRPPQEPLPTAWENPGVLEELARVKRRILPLPEVDLTWDSTAEPLGLPWTSRLEVREGERVSAQLTAIRSLPGQLEADPVIWLMRLEGRHDPETGEVMAFADEGPDESTLTLLSPPLPAGTYRLLVAPWGARRAGMADIEVTVDGIWQAGGKGLQFGGTLLAPGPLPAGALLFAGASAPLERGHDSVLFLLPAPGSSNGPTQASNNDLDTLPLIRLGRPAADPLLLVSAFSPGSAPAVSLYLSRLGAPGESGAEEDRDGDLLSDRLEQELATCAGETDADLARCRPPTGRTGRWSPADTDNDGFTDFEELYGIRRCYAKAPSRRGTTGPRCQEEGGRCRHFCTPGTALVAQLPLSALDCPRPTEYDIFLEYDYWAPEEAEPGRHSISPQHEELIKRAFEQEYRHGGPEGVPHFQPPGFPIRFHLFQDDALPMPSLRAAARLPAKAARSLFFNLFFTPDRKLTNSFHYLLGIDKGGGQGDVIGRAAIVGASGGIGMSVKMIHEIGHLLGLLHNHAEPNPDHAPFFLSVMSYGYTHTLPPPIDWDGSFPQCPADGSCPAGFRCADFGNRGQRCAPDCGIVSEGEEQSTHFARFSSGELELPVLSAESAEIPEQGFPRWFLPYLYCYEAAGRANSLPDRLHRFLSSSCLAGQCVRCAADRCDIDWNQDGRFEGAFGFDVDRDGKLNERPLADGSDLERMIALGASGLRVISRRGALLFYTGFTRNRADNLLPYPSLVHPGHGGFLADLTNRCDEAARWSHCRNQRRDEAALFRGESAADRAIEVRLPEEFCPRLSEGLTVTIRVKPFQIPLAGGETLLATAGPLSLALENRSGRPAWTATVAGEKVAEVRLADDGAVGRWTRLTATWSGQDRQLSFSARRGTLRLAGESNGEAADQALCEFTFGAASGEGSTFLGLLDDPMVIADVVPTLQ